MKKEYFFPKNQVPGGNSQAIKAESLIFIGGQMSLDSTGKIVGGNIEIQARNVFESINDILIEEGHAYEYYGGKKKDFEEEMKKEKENRK